MNSAAPVFYRQPFKGITLWDPWINSLPDILAAFII